MPDNSTRLANEKYFVEVELRSIFSVYISVAPISDWTAVAHLIVIYLPQHQSDNSAVVYCLLTYAKNERLETAAA